jgi:hypothetical protein
MTILLWARPLFLLLLATLVAAYLWAHASQGSKS